MRTRTKNGHEIARENEVNLRRAERQEDITMSYLNHEDIEREIEIDRLKD